MSVIWDPCHAPYNGKVQIIGRFQINPKLAKTKATRLIQDQGAEILFAATRELLIPLTSRSLHVEFILPGVGFVVRGAETEKDT